jgi:hypothetical protein
MMFGMVAGSAARALSTKQSKVIKDKAATTVVMFLPLMTSKEKTRTLERGNKKVLGALRRWP